VSREHNATINMR